MICLLTLPASAVDSLPFAPGEKLSYDIWYHWGPIWKKAATGDLSMTSANYHGQPAYKMNLACRTLSFADKVMSVRDTLNAYTTTGVKPLYYEKISNEGSYWGHDKLRYSYPSDGRKQANVSVLRRNRPQRDTVLWASDQPYDMLSVFYHLRTLDYSKFKMGQTVSVPIVTGRKCIFMDVKYMGRTLASLRNKKQFSAYRLYLSFRNDNNLKEDDDPIEVWLSDDTRKIPLKVQGKLPIGSLQAEYSGD
jgi:hypothetical protein